MGEPKFYFGGKKGSGALYRRTREDKGCGKGSVVPLGEPSRNLKGRKGGSSSKRRRSDAREKKSRQGKSKMHRNRVKANSSISARHDAGQKDHRGEV